MIKINKIIAFIILQVMLVSQISWAGPIPVLNSDNLDTLCPQVMINAQAFQEACRIYSFWSMRTPGMEYPRGYFPNAEVTVAALNAVPKKYRTSYHLGKKYSEGGNPKLYFAYKRFRKELQEKYGFKLEPYIAEKPTISVEQIYNELISIGKSERTYFHLNRTYEDGGNKELLRLYKNHKQELKEKYNFELEKKFRDEKYPDYDAAYKALMSREPGQRTRKSLDRNKKDKGNRTLLKACDKYGVELDPDQPQYDDKESALLALLERPIKLRTPKALRKSFADKGDILLYKACKRFEIPLPSEREVNDPYPDALTTLYYLLRKSTEKLFASVLQRGDFTLHKAYIKFAEILESKYGFTLPVKSRAQYQTVEDTLVGILKRAPDQRYVVSLEQKSGEGDLALAVACVKFRQELKEKYNFELPKKSRAAYPDFETAFLALMQRPAHLRIAAALKKKGALGGDQPLLAACRKFKIPLPSGKKVGKYNTAEDVMEALFLLPEYQRNGVWLARPKNKGGNPYLRDCYYILKDEIKEKFNYELPLQNRVYNSFEQAYSVFMARDRQFQTSAALREDPKTKDGALYAACKKFGIPIWNIQMNRYVIISNGKYYKDYESVDQVYEDLMAYNENLRTVGFLGSDIEAGGNPLLFEAYKKFRLELNEKYNFKLKNPKEHIYLTYEETIKEFFRRPLEQRTHKFLNQKKDDGGDPAFVEACKRFKIKLPSAQQPQAKYPTPEDTLAGILKLPENMRNVTDISEQDGKLFTAYYKFKDEIESKYGYVLDVKKFAKYQNAEQVLIAVLSLPENKRFYTVISQKEPVLALAYQEYKQELKKNFYFELDKQTPAVYKTVPETIKALLERDPKQRTVKALDMPYEEGGNKALLYACQRFNIPLMRAKIDGSYTTAEQTLKAYLGLSEQEREYKALANSKELLGNWRLLVACYRHKDEIKEKFNYEIKFIRKSRTKKYPDHESAKKALDARPKGQRSAKSLNRKKDDGGDWSLLDACREFNVELEPAERSSSLTEPQLNGYERFKGLILNASQDATQINIYDYWLTMQEVTGHEYTMIRDAIIDIFMPKVIQLAEGNGKYGDATIPMNLNSGTAFNMDDLTNAGMLAIIEALNTWFPDMTKQDDSDADSDLGAYIVNKIKTAIKQEKKTIYAGRWTDISLDQPSGNKGGDNSYSKKGMFGGGNKLTIENKLSGNRESSEDMAARFEKMQEVLGSVQRGDYSFFDDAGFEFNEKLLLSAQEKSEFLSALKNYFLKMGIFEKVPGKFAVWVMGSLGNLGMARKRLSDVNLLIVTDTENGQTRETLLSLRNLIGSGNIVDGAYDNYTLEIGKNAAYRDMMTNSLDFVNLIQNHDLGNAEDGIASIEAISLNAKGNGDNRALHRAQFHVMENIYQMGSNAVLLLESEEGFSDYVHEQFQLRVADTNMDYLFFMNEYLLYFFQKQLGKAISAHQFAEPLNNKKIQDAKINPSVQQKDMGEDKVGEIVAAQSDDNSGIVWISDSQVKLDGTIVNVTRVNGYLSLNLTGVLKKGINYYYDFWQQVLEDFDGSEIFVDDPKIDDSKIDVSMLVAMEKQTDQLCDVLEQQVNALHAGTEDVSRRLDHNESFDLMQTVELDNPRKQDYAAVLTMDKPLTKKTYNLDQAFRFIEKAI